MVFVGVDTRHVQCVELVHHEVALEQAGLSAMVNGSHWLTYLGVQDWVGDKLLHLGVSTVVSLV